MHTVTEDGRLVPERCSGWPFCDVCAPPRRCGLSTCGNALPARLADRWQRLVDGRLVDICDECARESVGGELFTRYRPGWTREPDEIKDTPREVQADVLDEAVDDGEGDR